MLTILISFVCSFGFVYNMPCKCRTYIEVSVICSPMLKYPFLKVFSCIGCINNILENTQKIYGLYFWIRLFRSLVKKVFTKWIRHRHMTEIPVKLSRSSLRWPEHGLQQGETLYMQHLLLLLVIVLTAHQTRKLAMHDPSSSLTFFIKLHCDKNYGCHIGVFVWPLFPFYRFVSYR